MNDDPAADYASGCGCWVFMGLAFIGLGFWAGYATAMGWLG